MKSLEQLLESWEAGQLSPQDLAELKEHLSGASGRASLVDEWVLRETICDAFRARTAAAAASAVAQDQANESEISPAPKTPVSRPTPHLTPRRRRFSWLVWHEKTLSFRAAFVSAMAVCLVVAAVLAYYANAAVCKLEGLNGTVAIEHQGHRRNAVEGESLYPGDLVHVATGGAGSLVYRGEGTRIELAGDVQMRILNPLRGKRLLLARGTLEAAVDPQPKWRPMTITTPQATATVVGTRFSLAATGAVSRLEVLQGAIRFQKTRPSAQDTTAQVMVGAGQVAVADPNTKLEVHYLTGFLSTESWVVPRGAALTDAGRIGTRVEGAPPVGDPRKEIVQCLRGYLLAPVSGDYTFWLASASSSASAELWFSSDDTPTRKRELAYLSPSGVAGNRPGTALNSLVASFQKAPNQKSVPQHLVQGRRYYIELWQRGASLSSLAIGWTLPGQPPGAPQMVDPQSLCPFLYPTSTGGG